MNKKILTALFAGMFAVSAFTACGKQIPETQNISASAYVPINEPQKSYSENISDMQSDKRDFQKLRDLMLVDYEHMTISDFQNKVWKITDTDEYRAYLEKLSKDEEFYKMKDSNDFSYFMFYILEPLTAEKWQSREYSGAAVSDFLPPSDNALLEYVFKLNILDADKIYVKDYDDLRTGLINTMGDILKNRTKYELRNKSVMETKIQAYIDEILQYMQTPELSIEIEFAYFPLSAPEEIQQSAKFNYGETEARRYSNGTEEDYRFLLALKKTDYQNMTVADFNKDLLDWANENHERMERINEDTAYNDFQIALTAEELSFVKMTVFLSGMENGKEVQGIYTKTQQSDPCYGEYLPQKTAAENGTAAWCSLYYQFSYSIPDAETVTVGERDRQIEDMINAVYKFWDEADFESMLKMSESDIVNELEKIADVYSTDNIIITTCKEQIHFESMDERGIMF